MKITGSKHPEEISIIGTGVEIDGNLKSNGSIRIDGKITGNITSRQDIIFGKRAEIKGEILGENITIGGSINGKIASTGKIIMEESAVVKGDLNAKILIINEGAHFEGRSQMIQDENGPEQNDPEK